MVKKKNQLGNVAFGGNWSEEILVNEELRSILDVIDKAVEDCAERDVEDETLLQAMLYVRKNVEKGPMLCAAFFKAVRNENQGFRQEGVRDVANMIKLWAGL